ncbi:hypothetical protein [Metasolibacillus sp. FSL K6-0083]|uniref:hypothetical protein n=1 Tax=Metasolibacillus sp. FSL K6-0083 TaxID=2921416 RepID=UPI003159A432
MKQLLIFIFGISFLVIAGCSYDENQIYSGETLKIGIVGNAPDVQEKNIIFDEIEIEQLTQKNRISSYDAIFITEENLEEASEPQYADIYEKAEIPFLFIKSKKSYFPFISRELSYKDAKEVETQAYAILYLKLPNGEQYTSKFSLYNDKESAKNIEIMYSSVFLKIEELKKPNYD